MQNILNVLESRFTVEELRGELQRELYGTINLKLREQFYGDYECRIFPVVDRELKLRLFVEIDGHNIAKLPITDEVSETYQFLYNSFIVCNRSKRADHLSNLHEYVMNTVKEIK